MSREPLLGISKGGFRALPYIIANEALERVANHGITPNMITYLMEGYGFDLLTGSNILFLWTAATELIPVIGAFLADSYVGRYRMIGFGSVTCLLGMFLLWLTAIIPGARPCNDSGSECTSRNIFQLALLVSSLGLISLGTGGMRSSSLAFGADQLVNKDNPGDARLIGRFFNWYYASSSVAAVIGMLFVVYIQDHFGWQVGFGVTVTLLVLSALFLFLASHLYLKVKARGGSVIPLAHVFVAAWNKRHLNMSSEVTTQVYFHEKESTLTVPSDKIRFLNKACIVDSTNKELATDRKALDPWRLCTVEQVEGVKTLIKVIPMWSTGIMLSVTLDQTSFVRLQAGSMDRHVFANFEIPAGSFISLKIIFFVLWTVLYDSAIMPLATKIIGKPANPSARIRMAVGILLAFLSMVLEAIVEGIRRKIAIDEGFADNPKAIVNMSALWLLPHFCASGIASSLFVISQNEFFYSEFPKSMSSVATSLFLLSSSMANLVSSLIMSSINSITCKGGKESWVSSNINKARFDYFFLVLAGICLLNFVYYLICNKGYGPSKNQEDILGHGQGSPSETGSVTN